MKLTKTIEVEYKEIKKKEIGSSVKNEMTKGIEMLLDTFKRELDYIEPHQNAGNQYEYSTLFDLTAKALSPVNLRKISPEEITEFTLLLSQFQERVSFHIASQFRSGVIVRQKQDTE